MRSRGFRGSLTVFVLCALSGFAAGFILWGNRVLGLELDSEFSLLWFPGMLFGLAYAWRRFPGDYVWTFTVLSAASYSAAAYTYLTNLSMWAMLLSGGLGAALLCLALVVHGQRSRWWAAALCILVGMGAAWLFTPLNGILKDLLDIEVLDREKDFDKEALGVLMGADFALWQAAVGVALDLSFRPSPKGVDVSLVSKLLNKLAGSRLLSAAGAAITIWALVRFFGVA